MGTDIDWTRDDCGQTNQLGPYTWTPDSGPGKKGAWVRTSNSVSGAASQGQRRTARRSMRRGCGEPRRPAASDAFRGGEAASQGPRRDAH